MSISKVYDPSQAEDKWYRHWMEKGYFHSEPDERKSYTIVIPPPNVTGVLHMGHMLNNTIQDVLIRRARLKGYNACWVPGTDHASIATEAKVVQKLRAAGIKKGELKREEFLQHAWEWTETHGGIILEQLKKLGASCDWERTAFTMDPIRSESVIHVFVDLFNKGRIYRGLRMVNWDPEAKTTVSDEEVIHKEVQSKLYYLKYKVVGEDGYLTVATTRPETILGDTAVCVNPKDPRYRHMTGKKVIVPVDGREVPVIADEYVDMEFGTGALKITPAHDVNDYEIGLRHGLEVRDIFHPDGRLNELGKHYAGKDRFEVRKLIVRELEEKGLLEKVESYNNKVGTSERTGAVIEPRLSEQWFLAMKELAQPALENVLNGNIKFYPAKFVNTYRYWMENVRDWCISRQLYWGHRIPAWYYGPGKDDFVVAHNEEEALQLARHKSGNPELRPADLRQDEDVLDTWFSSWLWPMSVFNGILEPDNPDIQYYYPTQVLVTAPEILFFWVARMIMAGYEYRHEKPFEDVYLTGIVRDLQGRKMSKSLGNSPDPLELMKQYGADGVRVGMLFSSPAGNDLLFDEKLCLQGRNFSNKIWNAMRLVKGWSVSEGVKEENKAALAWFESKWNQTLAGIEKSYKGYHLSEVLKTLYSFIWNDFCSWLLEMLKPGREEAIDRYSYERIIGLFEAQMKVLHPFMPFITEEIWHTLREREEGDDIIVSRYPEPAPVDEEILEKGEAAREIISKVRDIRNKNQLKQRDPVSLFIQSDNFDKYSEFRPFIIKLAVLDHFEPCEEEAEDAVRFMASRDRFFLKLNQKIDAGAERKRVMEEMEYLRGFMASVERKLSNERFVQNAPEAVVNKERQKLQDAREKFQSLEETLKRL